jgi:hypothetical protein
MLIVARRVSRRRGPGPVHGTLGMRLPGSSLKPTDPAGTPEYLLPGLRPVRMLAVARLG